MTDLPTLAQTLAQYAASCCQWLHDGTPRHYTDRCEAEMLAALKAVEREALERAANESPRLPYSWRFLNEDEKAKFMSGANCKKLAIRALIDTPVSETPDPRDAEIERLRALVRRTDEVLASYEKWEAALIMESEAWGLDLPSFTQVLFDAFIEIQGERNTARESARRTLDK